MSQPGEEQISGDEIYFGKLTLKEIKKHIFLSNHGQTQKFDKLHREPDNDTSLKLIETHSQPNLRPAVVNSPTFYSVPGTPVHYSRKSDDSFILLENKVSQLSQNAEGLELNNTLEIIDYILNNGPNTNKTDNKKLKVDSKNVSPRPQSKLSLKMEHDNEKLISESPLSFKVECKQAVSPKPKCDLSLKKELDEISESPMFDERAVNCEKYFTPVKTEKKEKCSPMFSTPSSVNLMVNVNTPMFKTPAPVSSKKKRTDPSPRKTPSKSNAYQHIASPIASYIRNCPQNLVVKDVPPRKELPTSIPKSVIKPSTSKTHNKENISLAPLVYKSAKKTKVV